MKKISIFLILLTAVLLFAVTGSYAQFKAMPPLIVKAIPVAPQRKKETRPNKYLVWVAEEWTPVEGKYFYTAGRWAMPPTPKSYYVPGSWQKIPGGYYRVPGRWVNPRA